MFAFVFCLFALLASANLAEPAEHETGETPRAVAEERLCEAVRAASTSQMETNPATQEGENSEEPNSDHSVLVGGEAIFLAERSNLLSERELFESSLINWLFFEDLAPEQQAIVRGMLLRCGVAKDSPSLAASAFAQWSSSQRATFVGITHALLNTLLIDSRDGKPLGNALVLMRDLIDIQGENNSLSSDQQFQLIVRLTPGALQKLEHVEHFVKGQNHIFHKEFPISFRQFRRIGLHGLEAGLHFCLTPDGQFAQIHIDYRFGLLHLGPANSDVRAQGNYRRHVDRWPQFVCVKRSVQLRRVVLQ